MLTLRCETEEVDVHRHATESVALPHWQFAERLGDEACVDACLLVLVPVGLSVGLLPTRVAAPALKRSGRIFSDLLDQRVVDGGVVGPGIGVMVEHDGEHGRPFEDDDADRV